MSEEKNQEAPPVAKVQQANEPIYIGNAEIKGKKFEMPLEPTKEATIKPRVNIRSFQELAEFKSEQERQGYFVDHSMMIRGVLEYDSRRTYLTGPAKFGKSINLTMLESFLDAHCSGCPRTKQENGKLFVGLSISEDQEFCQKHQQQYLVIKLDFSKLTNIEKDLKEMQKSLAALMCDAYEQLETVCDDPLFSEHLNTIKSIAKGTTGKEEALKKSLTDLASFIKKDANVRKRGTKIALLIDDLDKPFVSAKYNLYGTYESLRPFMQDFFSDIGDRMFDLVFFTGRQTFFLEEEWPCFDCLEIVSIFERPFHQWYGLHDAEMDHLLEETGLTKYKEGFRLRYGGYPVQGGKENDGTTTSYNPFSVLKAIKNLKFERYLANDCGEDCDDDDDDYSLLTKAIYRQWYRIQFGEKVYELTEHGEWKLPTFKHSGPIGTLDSKVEFEENDAWRILCRAGLVMIQQSPAGGFVAKTFNWQMLEGLRENALSDYDPEETKDSVVRDVLLNRDVEAFARILLRPYMSPNPDADIETCEIAYRTNIITFAMMKAHGTHVRAPYGFWLRFEEGDQLTTYAFKVQCLDQGRAARMDLTTLNKNLISEVDKAMRMFRNSSREEPIKSSNHMVIHVVVAHSPGKFILGYRDADKENVTYIDSDKLKQSGVKSTRSSSD